MSELKIPVKVVYDILRGSTKFNTIKTFLNRVPESMVDVKNLPMIRVVELNTFNESYASNKPLLIESTVQVDIWCKDIAQANQLYYEVDSLMADHNIMLDLGGMDEDPDFKGTSRIYKRYTVTQRIGLQ